MRRPSDSFRPPRGYFIGGVVLLLAGLMIGLGLSATFNLPGKSIAQRTEAVTAAATPLTNAPESPFVSVVDRALPAVVFIDVRKKVNASSDDPQDELMKRFFGDTPRNHPRVAPSSGSGFVIDAEGHVLTNNHVVRDADDITVTLNDKRTFKAKVVGADAQTDVAVIKIEGHNLPYLPLGDSDRLRVGDWAIAIGNPLGELKGSVTVGIISARGRSNLNIFGGTPDFQDFIQTDASINFGNSGGPLCNIRGEAIGINTAINPSGQGIGFAIPINLAKHVAEQLMANGSVKRAMLGVMLADLTPELAEGFGLSTQNGVVIQNVLKGSPAERAGLRRNDVIVEFDGQPVEDMQKFRLRVADTPSGKRMPISVLRDGKTFSTAVTLSDRDDKFLAQNNTPDAPAAPQSENGSMEQQAGLGLRVRELSPDERSSTKAESGVVVIDVADGSAADDAGLQPGDVIEEVGGKPVNSSTVFARMLRDAKTTKKHVVLLVNRGGQTRFVALSVTG